MCNVFYNFIWHGDYRSFIGDDVSATVYIYTNIFFEFLFMFVFLFTLKFLVICLNGVHYYVLEWVPALMGICE